MEKISVALEAHKLEVHTNWEAKMGMDKISIVIDAHETEVRTI